MSKNAEPGPALQSKNEIQPLEEVVLSFDTPIAELVHNLAISTDEYSDEQDQRTMELLNNCLSAADQLFRNEKYIDCLFLISDAIEYMLLLNNHEYLCQAIDIRHELDKKTGGLKGRLAIISAMYID